jgi:hypothetical protein
MSERASARRGMISRVTVGSKWTNGLTIVKVYAVESFDKYTYVKYHNVDNDHDSLNVHCVDALAFVNMFDLHTKVEPPKVRKEAPVYNEDTGRYRNVGWC